MDSYQLTSFYRVVPHWPKTPMEMNTLVENISRVLPAAFVAVYLTQGERNPELAFIFNDSNIRLGNLPQSLRISELPALPMIVEEFVKKQIHQNEHSKPAEKNDGSIRKTQVTGDLLGGYQLNIIPVNARNGSERRVLGWVIVGTLKPFSKLEDVLLIAINQRLIELAETDQLESEISLRSQFLSIASHELKTPLTSIYGMLQLQERTLRLKRDDAMFRDPEKQMSYLRRMLRQVERLNELIDGLLDISRIQNGRFMVEPSENDVAAILRESISLRLEQVAREAGVSLHLEAPETLHASVDPVRMEELVSNLVMNAVRFSPEGGVVWIRLKQDDGSFRLTVRDQGPSVPIEDRERIFRPFERAQRTARLGGLGLGLFISRQIALLHGGNVALVESVPGKGNVFEAHFPLMNIARASA